MRDEFKITRNGREYVLFAGLLDEAHNRFGKDGFSIETEPKKIQFGDDGEPLLAVTKAVVKTKNGEFHGIGDATRGNVGGAMRPHLIRMSETRAKARALRDAVNVGAATLEELGDEEGATPPQAGSPPRHASSAGSSAASGASKSNGSKKATQQQVKALEKLIDEVNFPGGIDGFIKDVTNDVHLPNLPKNVARKYIEQLTKRRDDMKASEEAEDDIEFDEEDIPDIDEVEGVSRGGAKTK